MLITGYDLSKDKQDELRAYVAELTQNRSSTSYELNFKTGNEDFRASRPAPTIHVSDSDSVDEGAQFGIPLAKQFGANLSLLHDDYAFKVTADAITTATQDKKATTSLLRNIGKTYCDLQQHQMLVFT